MHEIEQMVLAVSPQLPTGLELPRRGDSQIIKSIYKSNNHFSNSFTATTAV
jgi:hypothetical protein